mmetsp:Transcript_32397/g.107115  ORF Transcript_32397/g.107115 Transcript_32397/m.107115 type:complete len:196 (-) Transcript_32397:275-862(-)
MSRAAILCALVAATSTTAAPTVNAPDEKGFSFGSGNSIGVGVNVFTISTSAFIDACCDVEPFARSIVGKQLCGCDANSCEQTARHAINILSNNELGVETNVFAIWWSKVVCAVRPGSNDCETAAEDAVTATAADSGQITFNFLSNNKLGIGANVFTAAVESFVQACCDAGLCPEESPSVPPPSPPPAGEAPYDPP